MWSTGIYLVRYNVNIQIYDTGLFGYEMEITILKACVHLYVYLLMIPYVCLQAWVCLECGWGCVGV